MARSSQRNGSSVRGLFIALRNLWSLSLIGDYADVFDGAMIVLAMYILNLVHPGTYLQDEYVAVPVYNQVYNGP
jgi:hypothetical protein